MLIHFLSPLRISFINLHYGVYMENCSNLFYLSTIACKLSDCLSEKELAELSADLVTLSDMIANILAHQCSYNSDNN
ncbi:MAG: DUF6774 domain-containing protein [Acetatifactor sp.]